MTPTAFSPGESERQRLARRRVPAGRRCPVATGRGQIGNVSPRRRPATATLATATGGRSTELAIWPASRGGESESATA